MTRFDVFSRVITAAALVASAVTLGVWLNRPRLTAAPDAPPAKIAPEPILAPPPTLPRAMPTTIDELLELEIAASAAAAPESPAAKPLEPKTDSCSACQPRRKGILGRRWR